MISSLGEDEIDLHQINITFIIMQKITPQYNLLSKVMKIILASILQIREKITLIYEKTTKYFYC
jgi:hypothetical protein